MNRTLAGIVFALACLGTAQGEFQLPDHLVYGGQTWDIAIFPLEEYAPIQSGSLSLWWAPNTVFAANLRGYVATWIIDEDRLWLNDIEGCQGDFMGVYQAAALTSLFPDQADSNRIPADWFTGRISYPSFRFGEHLLPLSETRREAQTQWTITVDQGRILSITTNTLRHLAPSTARHPASIEVYSCAETYDLLARPEVCAELNLSPEQSAGLEKIGGRIRAEGYRSSYSQTRGYPDPEATTLLTDNQNNRLRELLLQMHGPSIFSAYSQHPSLAILKISAPDAAKKMNSAFGQVRKRYLDLCNAYQHRSDLTPAELELLSDAVEDVVAECDAASLAALPDKWQQEILGRMGVPLPIRWPRHTQRQPSLRATQARAKAKACRNTGCQSPERPDNFEFLNADSFCLSSEDIVFHRISPRQLGGRGRDFFLMETEVPNRLYALYLADTKCEKGDRDLLEKLRQQEQETDRVWSTADTPYDLKNTNLLWNGNIPPPGIENLPVALIKHTDAMDFCRWLNARYPGTGLFWLPTREQWCTAAYGGSARAFPWGDTWDPTIPIISNSRTDQRTEPVPVDSNTRDLTPEGIRHLGGNVQEYLAAVNPGEDLIPMDTSWAGSSFRSSPADGCPPTTPRRNYWGFHHGAASRQEDMGFRVVWIPNGCHALQLD